MCMSDRTTISVSESTKEELDAKRPEGTPWDTFLSSLVDASGMHEVHLSSSAIDDVANQVARKTADELETRLR
jgi:hypothetical protein